ncbi:MAG TPA: phosphoenolpyruvate carboxykinase (ATP), partial [Cyanobacteria bacterium UBA8553]|nr:phosphoenolpyruvate carboxykinase (ATP) [Cyanobacteria bacterium UBA8553]
MKNLGQVYWNLSVPQLVEHALVHQEGVLASNGALCVSTGKYTGRSPNDKFIVDEPEIHDEIDWNKVNVPISVEKFDLLYKRMLAYVQGKNLYIFDGYVGADPIYRL